MEAVKWFLEAANHGDVLSEYYLGIIYEKGVGGIERDLVKAHVWLGLYAINAPEYRDRVRTQEVIAKLEKDMSLEQINEATNKQALGNRVTVPLTEVTRDSAS